MPTLTDVPRSSEEWRAFLQSRVAGFGRILAAFVLGFYVFANAAAMLHPLARWQDWVQPLNILVLAAGLMCAAVWIACITATRTASELETIDGIATIATASCIGLTAIYGPPVHRPELAAIMGVVIFLILRAIVIPSSGPRTTVLSAISVVPAIYAAYACHARETPTLYTLPLPLYPALTAVWAGVGVVAATLASRTAALAEAHSIGLIHRDIKPANIALCERAGLFGVVKVLDFGLVKELGTDSSSTTEASLTSTPLYLSPEMETRA